MDSKASWEEICERLWGPDWIAPLSETLHVNRRTVERWKSGRIAIPSEFERMIVEALPMDRRINRELGDMLRRVAGGASHRQILDQIEEYHHAYRELLGMKLRRASIFRTAVSRNDIFEED